MVTTTSKHVNHQWVKENSLKAYIKAKSRRAVVLFSCSESANALGGKLFTADCILAVIVTFGIIKPDMSMNPVLKVGGYWNICIAIDYDPSRFLGLYGWVLTQLLWTLSAWLFYARARGNEDAFGMALTKWVKVSALVFVFASPAITWCFMIVPTLTTMSRHTMPFNVMVIANAQWYLTQWLCAVRVMPAGGSLPLFTLATFAHVVASVMKVYEHLIATVKYDAMVEKYGRAEVDAMPADLLADVLSYRQLIDLVWLMTIPLQGAFHMLHSYMPLSESGNHEAHVDLQSDAKASKENAAPQTFAELGLGGRSSLDLNLDGLGDETLVHLHPPYMRAPVEDEAMMQAMAERVARSFQTDFKATACPTGGSADADHGCTLGVCRATLSFDAHGFEALHPDLRKGFFSEAGSYPGIVRLSCGDLGAARVALRVEVPSDMKLLQDLGPAAIPDSAGTQHGGDEESLALLRRLQFQAADGTRGRFADFLFAEHMKEFCGVSAEAAAAQLDMKNEGGFLSRTCKKLYWLNATLRARTLRHLYNMNLYHNGCAPTTGVFGKQYHGGLPFRLGDGYCKWGLIPRQKHLCKVAGRTLNDAESLAPKATRDAAMAAQSKARYAPGAEQLLKTQDAVFDFVVQVATNSDHRADVADSIWPEDLSPYVPVGTLTIHQGQGLSDVLYQSADKDGDHLAFNPWNQLAAHRPVGAANYARAAVYALRQRLRAERDGVTALTSCPFLAVGGKSGSSPPAENDKQHVHSAHMNKLVLKSHIQAQIKRSVRLFTCAEDAFRKGCFVFLVAILVCLALEAYNGLSKTGPRREKIVTTYRYYHVSVLFHGGLSNDLIMEYGWLFVLSCWLWSAWLFYARVRGCVAIFGNRSVALVKISAAVFALAAPGLVMNFLTDHMDAADPGFINVSVVSFDAATVAMMQFFFVQWYIGSRCMPSGSNFVAFTASVSAFLAISLVKIVDHAQALKNQAEGPAFEWCAWRQALDVAWYLSIILIDRTHVMREYAPLAEQHCQDIDIDLMSAEAKTERVHLATEGGDGDGEAVDAVSDEMLENEWVPFVKCPDEDVAANEKLGKAVADAFEGAFRRVACPVGGPDVDQGWTLGVLRATLEIDEDGICALHPQLRAGFFKMPRKYPAIIRVHCTDACVARMSIRVEVPDDMVLITDEDGGGDGIAYGRHADFMMAENLKEFWGVHANVIKALLETLNEQSGWKRLGIALPWFFQIVRLVALRSLYARSIFKGGQAPITGLWGKEYYGGLPFRLGPGACKWGLLPRQHHPCGMAGNPLSVLDDQSMPELERSEMQRGESTSRYVAGAQEWLKEKNAVFDFAIQVATDQEHDLVNGEAVWNEDLSPYLPVGRLTIHKGQQLMALLRDQEDKNGEHLRFNVWNQLSAHRPVGPTNWARKHVYARRQDLRAHMNGVSKPTLCPFLTA